MLACLVCTENRREPCDDLDLRRCSFISIPKHMSIPRRAARLSVLSLCLKMAGHQLNVKEAKTKHKHA